jgi:hypothetical protein
MVIERSIEDALEDIDTLHFYEQLSDPQILTLISIDVLENSDVLGWHQPDGGPLICREDGSWQTVTPDGRLKTVVTR